MEDLLISLTLLKGCLYLIVGASCVSSFKKYYFFKINPIMRVGIFFNENAKMCFNEYMSILFCTYHFE